MVERPTLIEGNMPDLFEQLPVEAVRPVDMKPRQWYVPDVVQQYRQRREMRRVTRSGRR